MKNKQNVWIYIVPSIRRMAALLMLIFYVAVQAPAPTLPVIYCEMATSALYFSCGSFPATDGEEGKVNFFDFRSITASTVSVGDTFLFGCHIWRVLDVQGNNALVITEYIIGTRTFHYEFTEVTWETSEIREYLNGTFLNAFSEAERARIVKTTVINHNNPWDFTDWGGEASTPGGNNTNDWVFLLSIDEVLRYFGDSGLVAIGATLGARERDQSALPDLLGCSTREDNHYSKARIARNFAGFDFWWWLRTPGIKNNEAVTVLYRGYLDIAGFPVFFYGFGGGLRPAMWLYLKP